MNSKPRPDGANGPPVSLKHILLGMLEEPHSGYDLKKAFNQSLKNFWNAELSQIYPQLSKLEKDGLLSSKQVASASGPPRRVYRRTTRGKNELLTWLAEGPVIGDERISFLAQVFFLSQFATTEAALAFMLELREHMLARIERFEGIEKGWMADDPRYPDALPDSDFFPQLTLALGIKRGYANLEWCDECIQRIRNRQTAHDDERKRHLP